jgi:hypothetical protein
MTKDEVVNSMLEKFNELNVGLAKQYGMSEEDIIKNMEQAASGLEYMFSELYDHLVVNNIISNS